MRQNYNVGSIVNGSEDQANNGILEKYCYRHGTNTSDYTNCLAWGALYQWDEAMNHAVTPGAQGICPTGWHLPTEAEYHGLELSLASPPDEANCDGGRDNVYDCDPAATALSVGGSSGFDCALGGYRASNGYFLSGNSICLLFSSELSGGYEISYMAYPGFDIGTRRRLEDSAWGLGRTVRCVKN